MKAHTRILSLALAASLVGFSALSCQNLANTTAPTAANVIASPLALQTAHGMINLRLELPYAKAFPALHEYNNFKTQALEENRINRIRVTITNVTTDFRAEKVIPLDQGGMVARVEVPLGKNYIISVQGMDDLDEVPGARVKGVFSIESAATIPDVDVTPTTTAVAEVLERVRTRSRDFAAKVDTVKLQALITEGKSAASPFLVNFDAFANVIIAAQGEVPLIVPPNPVVRAGNVTGTISGLSPGDAAIVFTNDPASRPFIVVAPPPTKADIDAASDPNSVTVDVTYRIDNVPPGTWRVRVVASGYRVEGDRITNLDEVSATKPAVVTANGRTVVNMDVKKVGWQINPFNASANIGSSDQPDAEVDGSDGIHMVWRQDGFQDSEESGSVLYSRWNGITWSTDNRFVSLPGDNKLRGGRNPAVGVGIDRTPHVVWSAFSDNPDFKGRRVAFSRFDGVKWLQPQIISVQQPTQDVGADHPDIAINPINNHAFAVWSQLDANNVRTIMLSEYNGKAWGAPITVSPNTVQAIRPRVAVGTDRMVHIGWEVDNSSQVQYISWDGKKFTPVENVPFNQSNNQSLRRNLDMRVDRLNRLHLIRRSDDTIQYLFRSNTTWSRSEPVHEVQGVPLSVLSHASLYIDQIGNVNAVWASSLDNGTQILRYRRRTNEGWEIPRNYSGILATPTPTPTSFPTPTPNPSGTPIPTPTPGLVGGVTFLGYDNVPGSVNKIPADRPLVVVDTRGRISALWSNGASDPANSDIFHSTKSTPLEDLLEE